MPRQKGHLNKGPLKNELHDRIRYLESEIAKLKHLEEGLEKAKLILDQASMENKWLKALIDYIMRSNNDAKPH